MAHSTQRQPNRSELIRVAEQHALSMGTEDIYGFWELVWAMRAEYPELSQQEILLASQEALTGLLERRLVRIVWWDPSTDSDSDITFTDAASLVQDQSNWMPPIGRFPAHPRFTDTRLGERTYYAGLTASPRCVRR